ncbi:hypothetical protein EV657_1321, partial [Rhodovulum visakhapatnamense]
MDIIGGRLPTSVRRQRTDTVYAAKVSDLAAALNDPASRPEAVEILRGLIE